MTERIFKSMMKKIPSGEYKADPREIYNMICPKSYRDMTKWDNVNRRIGFEKMFYEKKYGFEYMFKEKIRYIGTNDLDTLIVEK